MQLTLKNREIRQQKSYIGKPGIYGSVKIENIRLVVDEIGERKPTVEISFVQEGTGLSTNYTMYVMPKTEEKADGMLNVVVGKFSNILQRSGYCDDKQFSKALADSITPSADLSWDKQYLFIIEQLVKISANFVKAKPKQTFFIRVESINGYTSVGRGKNAKGYDTNDWLGTSEASVPWNEALHIVGEVKALHSSPSEDVAETDNSAYSPF